MSVFYFFDQLPSTNQWALEQNRSLPFFCIAYEQSAGRGRGSHTWQDQRGDLLLTYATQLTTVTPHLSLLCGLHLAEFFHQYNINIKLKWPNDLILFDHNNQPCHGNLVKAKVGGILVENKRLNNTHKVVIGIGINLSDKHHERTIIAQDKLSYHSLLMHISQIFSIITQEPPLPLDFDTWQNYDCLYQQWIDFDVTTLLPHFSPIKQDDTLLIYRYRLLAKGIDALGRLKVSHPQSGFEITLNHAFNIRLAYTHS